MVSQKTQERSPLGLYGPLGLINKKILIGKNKLNFV